MKDKLIKPYPLWKVDIEDQLINGNVYTLYKIYAKCYHNDIWNILYTTYNKNWCGLALEKLKEMFDVYIYKWLDNEYDIPSMFEIDDQIYKTKYIFPDKSHICGTQVEGNLSYGEYTSETLVFDYIQSNVIIYNKNTCLIKNKQVFIDGNLIYRQNELENICDTVGQDIDSLNNEAFRFIDYIKKLFDIDEYICDNYTYYVKNN